METRWSNSMVQNDPMQKICISETDGLLSGSSQCQTSVSTEPCDKQSAPQKLETSFILSVYSELRSQKCVAMKEATARGYSDFLLENAFVKWSELFVGINSVKLKYLRPEYYHSTIISALTDSSKHIRKYTSINAFHEPYFLLFSLFQVITDK